MTWKPSARAVGGSLRHCRCWRKQDAVNTQGFCVEVFLCAMYKFSFIHSFKQSKSKVRVMLITFFDVRGMVHSEFLPQGQTINQQVYKEILWHLLHLVYKKRWELWQTMHLLTTPWASGSSWPRRTSLYWKNLPIHLILLCVTFLFPKLKGIIKGTYFEDVEAVKRALMMELTGIPEESFQQCIEAWQRRMEKCIRLEGNYFEEGSHVVCCLESK